MHHWVPLIHSLDGTKTFPLVTVDISPSRLKSQRLYIGNPSTQATDLG